jgi:hypothetical protein
MSGQALAFMLIMWGAIVISATVCLRAVLKSK